MYLNAIPNFIQSLFNDLIWSIPSKHEVFITFDDGPTLEGTEVILNILEQYEAKATFFCLGEHIKMFPKNFQLIAKSGHGVGNHGFKHLNGWTTNSETYIENTIEGYNTSKSKLFRPPYGKITPIQIAKLKKQFKIVMWDIFPGDFDESVSQEDCLNKIIKHLTPGSIIVLHDNKQSIEKVKYILPKLLNHLKKVNLKTGVIQ